MPAFVPALAAHTRGSAHSSPFLSFINAGHEVHKVRTQGVSARIMVMLGGKIYITTKQLIVEGIGYLGLERIE